MDNNKPRMQPLANMDITTLAPYFLEEYKRLENRVVSIFKSKYSRIRSFMSSQRDPDKEVPIISEEIESKSVNDMLFHSIMIGTKRNVRGGRISCKIYATVLVPSKGFYLFVKGNGRCVIFSSHLFDRYRERFLKDLSMNKLDVINTFVKQNENLVMEILTTLNDDGKPNVTVDINDGRCMGYLADNGAIFVSTFISEDLFKGEQGDDHEKKKNHFETVNGIPIMDAVKKYNGDLNNLFCRAGLARVVKYYGMYSSDDKVCMEYIIMGPTSYLYSNLEEVINPFIISNNLDYKYDINGNEIRIIIFVTADKPMNESIEENVKSRVTPAQISELSPNEIFVFGSNLQGQHAGGAAKFAYIKFGAEWGNGVGLQGQSYAIPTLNFAAYDRSQLDELKLPVPIIGKYVKKFLRFAKSHPDKFFYVTPIGCGIAGFTEAEMAPLFKGAVNLSNVALPQCFWDLLGGAPEEGVIAESRIRGIVDRVLNENFRDYAMSMMDLGVKSEGFNRLSREIESGMFTRKEAEAILDSLQDDINRYCK